MTYDSEVLADSPVIYLKLGESSGTTAVDSSGNANDFTYAGTGVTLGASGMVSDGSTAVSATSGTTFATRASIPAALANPAASTLEAWVNLASTLLAHSVMGIGSSGGFGFGISSGSDTTWNNTGNKLVGVASPTWVPSGFAIGSAGIHHLVVARDATNWSWYVDGALLGTHAAVTQTSATGTCYAGGLTNGTNTFQKLAWYASKLSATRVAAHYAAASGGGTPRAFHVPAPLRRQAIIRASSY